MTIISRIILFSVLLLIDIYVFQAVKLLSRNLGDTPRTIIYWGFWSITAFTFLIILLNSFIDLHKISRPFAVYSVAFIIAAYLAKVFIVLFLLIDDLIRLIRWVVSFFQKKREVSEALQIKGNRISRIEFFSQLGFIVGSIPFLSMVYGMIRGPYRFEVRTQKIKFPNLPSSFDGLKIVQISDIHSGSFMSAQPMKDIVNLVMKQKADIVFFTGDLVNNRNSEMIDEFKSILKQITAPMGVYSIFGNHDYGDYVEWDSPDEKLANRNSLIQTHKELGWKLLLNEHAILDKGGDKIGLIGVENWSSIMRHNKHGDMVKATSNLPEVPFKILLSHDPSHWHSEVTPKYKDIDLTLSGHTHGMQWGIEIPGFHWSPVQYVYKEWAGLYQKESQYIYVNRGVGFLGYPGRVGIMPEVTVIELGKA